MTAARLIRRIRFHAAHRYRRAEWSEAENRIAFGAQADAHEHDWVVEVHVAGPVDARTGWAVDLGALDETLAALTVGWDGGDLNAVVPPVADGSMTPSTENLARWLFEQLVDGVREPARVVEVRVFESPDLGSVYPA